TGPSSGRPSMTKPRPKPPSRGRPIAALATSTPGSAARRSDPSRITCATPAAAANRGPRSDILIAITLSTSQPGPTARRGMTDARDVARVQGQQRADAYDTQDHAERAARGRKGDTFGQELADDAAAGGADRGADRHLAPPDGRANEEKVCDIRARDQQDERDRA